MKTVLHVILSLDVGGMEQVAADLLRSLDKSRFRPVVVCLDFIGPLGEELQAEGIEVVRLKPMLPVLSFLFPLELIRVIRKYHADVIHVHSGCWHKAAMAGWLAGVQKIIYTEHGRLFPDKWKTIILDWLFCRITHNVVTVSGPLADYLAQVVRIPTEKISVIVNGIDVTRFDASSTPFSSDSGRIRIGIIARLELVKDIRTLLRAMRTVIDRYPDVLLDIAGEGTELAVLQDLARRLDIHRSVNFLGLRRDIPYLMAHFDIFVLSSLSEGTSITLLEAMASAKPVVVTRVGGNPQIVEQDVNGLLVPSGDPEAMAAAIVSLIENDEMRRQMGSANRIMIENKYSARAMTECYENMYMAAGMS